MSKRLASARRAAALHSQGVQSMHTKWRLLALVAVLAVVSAACGGDGDAAANDSEAADAADDVADDAGAAAGAAGADAGDLASLGGALTISGSSTVQPISQAVAEEFNALAPNVATTVDGPGTG